MIGGTTWGWGKIAGGFGAMTHERTIDWDTLETTPDDRPAVQELFRNLQRELPDLERLLAECNGHWGYDDRVYRFYHKSFKVYDTQNMTLRIVEKLRSLAPAHPLDDWFSRIVTEGTGKKWKEDDNERWLEVTRPILEAFFHARYFLEMAVKSGRELKFPPRMVPSGWAALLELYGLR